MNNNLILFAIAGIALFFATRARARTFPALPPEKITGRPMTTPTKVFKTPQRGLVFENAFRQMSIKYNIPPGLLSRIAQQESDYDPTARSPVGAIGLMQFMPPTAKDMGIDPLNPQDAIKGAAKYLRWLYGRTGSWQMALAAYNWGIGNLERKGFAVAPQETQLYVAQISEDTGVV